MDFYSWLYGHNKKPDKAAQDAHDETWAEHLAHHHPNGYDPSTDRCSLVDRDKGVDVLGDPPSRSDVDLPHYYGEISKGKSFEEMRDWLERNCGGNTKCVFTQRKEDFASNGIPDRIFNRFVEFGDYPSKADFEDSCRRFYEVTQDLRTRFKNIPLDIDWYIPFNFTRQRGGCSTLDRRNKVSYIGNIGKQTNLRKLGGTSDEANSTLVYDITRHEIGHNLSKYSVLSRATGAIDGLRQRIGSDDLFRTLYTTVSPYASYLEANLTMGVTKRPSMDYILDVEETIAEIFSRFTNPNYQIGEMPKEFEELCAFMVRGYHNGGKEAIVMDSLDEGKCKGIGEGEAKDGWEDFIKTTSIYYGQGPTKFGYWDRHTGEWVAMSESGLWARTFQELANGTFSTMAAVRKKYALQ